jgi:hypothetical protein
MVTTGKSVTVTTTDDPEAFKEYIDVILRAMATRPTIPGQKLIIDKTEIPGHTTVYSEGVQKIKLCCVPSGVWDAYWESLKAQTQPVRFPWEPIGLNQLFGIPVLIAEEEK